MNRADEALSWEEARVVQADWTVACGGKWHQLDRQHEALGLVKRKVIARTLRDGREQIICGGVKWKWRGLPDSPERVKASAAMKIKAVKPPGTEHPGRWGGSFGAGSRPPPANEASGSSRRMNF